MQSQRTESKRKLPPGIRERQSRKCLSRTSGKCDCTPTIEASI
jgi:hypothetical protein